MAKSKNSINKLNKVLNPPKFKHSQKAQKSHKNQPPSKSTPTKPPSTKAHPNQASQKPTVPFAPLDSILLLGEADFSFAASLATHHGATHILATSLDSEDECLAKYPLSASNHLKEVREAYEETYAEAKERFPDGPVLFGVDATKVDRCREVKRVVRGLEGGGFDWIVFNFPHVGGLSGDVNRQVRANQALLHGFFGCAKGLLSSDTSSTRRVDELGEEQRKEGGGSVLVTLFEGSPYELWNVRDLARSQGFVVRRSWRFEAGLYPMYRHARTLGVVRKGGEEGVEVSDTAWKGEDRLSRTYEFGLPGKETAVKTKKERKKKRRGHQSSSDEESGDD